MPRIPALAIVPASVGATLAVRQAVNLWDARINNFAGVGGPEAFARQRAAHLERLRNNGYVIDPEVRAQDSVALDGELDELERRLPTQELGEELRIVR